MSNHLSYNSSESLVTCNKVKSNALWCNRKLNKSANSLIDAYHQKTLIHLGIPFVPKLLKYNVKTTHSYLYKKKITLKYLNKSLMQILSLRLGFFFFPFLSSSFFFFWNQVHAPTILAYVRHGFDYAIHFKLWPKSYTYATAIKTCQNEMRKPNGTFRFPVSTRNSTESRPLKASQACLQTINQNMFFFSIFFH